MSYKTKKVFSIKVLPVIYVEEYEAFQEARKRESYFKTAAGRRFLKKKLGA
jgi:hypothetical protein